MPPRGALRSALSESNITILALCLKGGLALRIEDLLFTVTDRSANRGAIKCSIWAILVLYLAPIWLLGKEINFALKATSTKFWPPWCQHSEKRENSGLSAAGRRGSAGGSSCARRCTHAVAPAMGS